jgi:hypothetical protein
MMSEPATGQTIFVHGPTLSEFAAAMECCCYADRLLNEVLNGHTTADTIRGLACSLAELAGKQVESTSGRMFTIPDLPSEAAPLLNRLKDAENMLELELDKWTITDKCSDIGITAALTGDDAQWWLDNRKD